MRFVVLLSLLCACGGRVASDVPEGPPGTGGTEGETVPIPGVSGETARPVMLTDVRAITFVPGYLYVEAKADGVDTFLVLRRDGNLATVVEQRPDLRRDQPRTEPVDATTLLRLHADEAGTSFELLDVRRPEHPVSTVERRVDGTIEPGWRQTFAVDERALVLCLRPAAGAPTRVTRVSLDATKVGGSAIESFMWTSGGTSPSKPCGSDYYLENTGTRGGGTGLARGPFWITWGTDQDLDIWRVHDWPEHLGDYYYNPSGVHAYGPVQYTFTDGARVAFDPRSDSEFFLWSMEANKEVITHAVLGLPGPKRLVAVAAKHAYVATQGGVRRYDIDDVDAPRLAPEELRADFGELPRPLSESDAELALVAKDRIYLVPFGLTTPDGQVEPLRVVAPR
ncbi:MAG: hypothetical protein HOO96_26235 [Polyangiaceae bacterium]|nr:hypothetical protein [Polyangiaceae bacterium]